MGPRLVPATIVAALLGFATAAATAGAAAYRPSVWPATVALAVLGGVTPMIYAVNIRVVPVFARRAWPSEGWLRVQVALGLGGAWTVFLGRLTGREAGVALGSALALAGGLAFAANVACLFRRPAAAPAPPLPFPEQATVDRLATRFTRLAGIYVLVGLGIGLVTSMRQPATGPWDLVWAHAMLVGFFLSMAAGVSYHVLSRWTGRPWRSVGAIRLHLLLVTTGLPVMLLALATDQAALFAVAGPLQAGGLALFLAAVAPMVPALPGPTRPAFGGAIVLLLVGVTLGAAFALDPALGARLRLAHAGLNLFGWTGLLVSGIGYYLVPRFFGRPLAWPRLAPVQLATLGGGALLGAAAWGWRAAGGPPAPIAIAQGLVTIGFLLFAGLVVATYRGRPGTAVMTLAPRRPLPGRGLGSVQGGATR